MPSLQGSQRWDSDRKHSLGSGPSLGLTGGHLVLWGRTSSKGALIQFLLPPSLTEHHLFSGSRATPGCHGVEGEPREALERRGGGGGVVVPGWSCTGVQLTLPGARPPTREACQLFFTASLGETSSLPFLKTIEPSQGISLETKCSTIFDCVPRSPVLPRGLPPWVPLLPGTQSSSYLMFSITLGLGSSGTPARLLFCVLPIASSTVQTL